MEWRILVHSRDVAVIDLGFTGAVASSAPFQPPVASLVVFRRVGEDFNPGSLAGFYENVRREIGRRDSIVLLTSVDLEERLEIQGIEDPPGVAAVSIGLTPPTCPGAPSHEPLPSSTINVAVAVKTGLTHSGLMDLFRTVVEAKTLASVELLLRCSSRSPGTVSDAVAVIAEKGKLVTAGPATRVGGPVAEAVYGLITRAGARILAPYGYVVNALGYTLEELVGLALEAYRRAPVPGVGEEEVRLNVRKVLEGILRDPNVAALLIAARDLDLRGLAGTLPGLTGGEFKEDPRSIVADELLATALSLYIAGFKGLLAAYWVERLKSAGEVSITAPVFEDDVISALVGSALSLVYDRLLGGGWSAG